MPSIQSLTMTYDALNEEATFSEGDIITGKVTLVLLKETEVEEFFVKVKGDANVRWTESHKDRHHTYSSHRRFFKLKQFFIPENVKGTVLPAGTHVHNFSFKIPSEGMPSSFKGYHGKIVYTLEAKVSRSWRMDSTAEKEFKFASKCFPNIHHLMSQQVLSTDKEMGIFSKGRVHMDAIVERTAYAPGETVNVVAKVNNSSSKDMRPKFSLKQNVLYCAQGHRKYQNKVVSKAVGDVIYPQKEETVKCALKIPADEILTIHNCDIISVEYTLKVSLDISFSFDPEVCFPVVVFSRTCLPGGAMGPYPAMAVSGPSKSDFPPPALSAGPYPVSPGQGAYGGAQGYSANPSVYPNNPAVYPGFPGMYPAHPAHVAGGYNNPVPRGPSPYGSPFSSSASSPVRHPPPAGPAFHPPPSAPAFPLPPTAPAIPSPPTAPAIPSPPSAPAFPSPPTAPDLHPPPYESSVSSSSPSVPMYMPSSLAAMNTNFLSQSDEAPPAYMSLFPQTSNTTSTEESTPGSDAK